MKRGWVYLFVIPNLVLTACGNHDVETGEALETVDNPAKIENPPEKEDRTPACLKSLHIDQLQPSFHLNCKKASSSQLKLVNRGNDKREQFLSQCYKATNNSCWCDQLIRPNPESIDLFHCTYGLNQDHQLIHPDEDTWKNAFEAVKIVEEFEANNILTEIIYNWWRPEPYNKNVGGASSRHPHGTSVDVRFLSKASQEKAFKELCKMRKAGRVRAIGYYATTALHFGIGDSRANTWGKNCP